MRQRRGDSDSTAAYFRFTRYVKSAIGLVAGCSAGIMAIVPRADGLSKLDLVVVVALAVLSGLMIDAPQTTKLVRLLIDALPWTPPPPKEKTDESQRPD